MNKNNLIKNKMKQKEYSLTIQKYKLYLIKIVN